MLLLNLQVSDFLSKNINYLTFVLKKINISEILFKLTFIFSIFLESSISLSRTRPKSLSTAKYDGKPDRPKDAAPTAVKNGYALIEYPLRILLKWSKNVALSTSSYSCINFNSKILGFF